MVFPVENRGGPRPLPVPPQDDTDFQTALRAAQTATEKARSTRSPTDIADADAKWATVESMVEYDYLLAAQSAEPAGATTTLDGQYETYFRGQGVSTEIYDKVVLTAKTEVQQETPVEQQYQLDLFEARQVVTDAEAALQAKPNDPTALYNSQSAITNLLNLEIQHQVSLMGPQGPNGTYRRSVDGCGQQRQGKVRPDG